MHDTSIKGFFFAGGFKSLLVDLQLGMSQFPCCWDGYFIRQVKIVKLLDFASFFIVEISFSLYPLPMNIILSLNFYDAK